MKPMEPEQNDPELDQVQKNQAAATGVSRNAAVMTLEAAEDQDDKKRDAKATAITIVVVGVAAALISAELLTGVLIGVAAAFLPGVGRHIRPYVEKTVEAGAVAARKPGGLVAEISRKLGIVKSKPGIAEVAAPPMAEATAPVEA